jgi:hypothetical protein
VVWHEVKAGIRQGGQVQVEGKGLTGQVVILGQQLVEDGSLISIPDIQSISDGPSQKVSPP